MGQSKSSQLTSPPIPTLGLAIALLLCLNMIMGCADSSMGAIDKQTSELIRQHWAQSMGHEAVEQMYEKPRSQSPDDQGRDIDKTRLSTTNPQSQELPARSRTRNDPDELGKLFSDDMSNAVEMDLQELLGYAIANSRQYRYQKETLYIEALNLLMEEHLWGPRFFAEVDATVSGTPESGDYDHALDIVTSFGVTHRLPNGGSVSATALVNFVNLLQDASSGSGEGQDASIELEASIPLLRGAGSVARESLIQAKRDLIYAARTFERYRREFLISISTRYYDLIRRQAELRNRQRQLKSLEWLSEQMVALAKAGRQPPFEIQRSEQQVLFARNSLINSQESYDAALDSLKLQIGMTMNQSILLKPIELQIPEPFLEPEKAITTAWEYRLDLQTSRDQVDDASRAVRNARNDLLPDLDINASVTLNTDSNKTNAGVDFEAGDSDYSVGMSYGAPLDRRREQLALRKSIISRERAWRDYTQSRDEVALEVRSSIRQIQQSRFSLALQQRNIEVSAKRVRNVVLRLRQLGSRDFTEAQDDLLEAENTRDSALRDLRVSILQYLLNTGQMRVDNQGHWKAPVNLVPMEDPQGTPSPDKMIKDMNQAQEELLKEADELLKQSN
jgi:outer membrane protein TolC